MKQYEESDGPISEKFRHTNGDCFAMVGGDKREVVWLTPKQFEELEEKGWWWIGLDCLPATMPSAKKGSFLHFVGGDVPIDWRGTHAKAAMLASQQMRAESVADEFTLPLEQIEAADDVAASQEKDPNGLDQHQAGAKLDAGKVRPSLVLNGFADALAEVFEVAEYGAQKYTPYGWREVTDGQTRYTDAKLRHQLSAMLGEVYDPETGLRHAAQEAWNALAVLQLQIEADRARR